MPYYYSTKNIWIRKENCPFPLHLSVSLPLALRDVDDYVGGFYDARCLIVHHIFTFIQKLSQWDVGDNVGGLSDAGCLIVHPI